MTDARHAGTTDARHAGTTEAGHAGMTEARRALVAVSAAIGASSGEALDRALGQAKRVAEHAAVEEMLLQSYLFVGFPAAINALARWRVLSNSTPANVEAFAPQTWMARGEQVCETVYAGQYVRLRENVRALHPNLEDWMLAEGYGKVLGRPGLDLPTRELGIVALLACQDAPKQLHSHLRGALNAGADPSDVDATLELVSHVADGRTLTAARELWSSIREPDAT